MNTDLLRKLSPTGPFESSLAPAARAASANGTGVDLQGYEGAVVIVAAGAFTDGSHVITLEHATASGGTFTTVSSPELIGTLPTINQVGGGNQTYKAGYVGTKRFVRAVTTVANGSTGCVYGVTILRGAKRHNPSAD